VLASVKHLVLPKLAESRQFRTTVGGNGKLQLVKKKTKTGVRDVVVEG
jgi:hypothetical protein